MLYHNIYFVQGHLAIPLSDYDKLVINRITDGDGNNLVFDGAGDRGFYRYFLLLL